MAAEDRWAAMERTLDRIEARQAIHDLLMRYCRGVDRLDRDMILSVYHPDAWDDHGSFKGSPVEFADWVMSSHRGKVISCTHFLANSLVSFESDDVAHGESYVIAVHRHMRDGALHDMMGAGRYIDRFERRGGEWRLSSRIVIGDWDRLDPVERQVAGPLTEALAQPSRTPSDPSYASGRIGA
ncbi:nuclear transport factor 2 family protein [Rhizorhabdus dicambivorans]|uniref:Nuclear transport factor 2 family protein n=1 Tax=Rhizorhabdus dicambivorans TaxID=1850238 RepID=A0A2A4FYY3_9SPHN|nr:nuclear transport factor 2 family protein [Rhizorhabdus dicambivorans]ATE65836.1 nuclear transport factor 2 family protein [Rhizorhabdus dicambivorans]PCE42950.1 nuclear transport factor 2 family protein [Rhizorhabdus dicambivorans]